MLRMPAVPDVLSASGAHVEIRGLTKTFTTDSGTTVALDNIDLRIKEGEFISLLGPSGCGKSTLLMVMAGLIAPTGGTLLVSGKPVQKPLTDVGIVFQRD